jgi:hypothetical protein
MHRTTFLITALLLVPLAALAQTPDKQRRRAGCPWQMPAPTTMKPSTFSTLLLPMMKMLLSIFAPRFPAKQGGASVVVKA